jgi:hypothetical protein
LTSAQIAVIGAMVSALALVSLFAVTGIPRIARLVFVHRLEVIRDDCVDAILAGQVSESPSVARFLKVAETGAEQPRLLTMPWLFAVSRAMIDLGVVIPDTSSVPGYDDLPPAAGERMKQLHRRLCAAYRSYLAWGSPAGWILHTIGLIARLLHPGSTLARTDYAVPAAAWKTAAATPARTTADGFTYGYLAGP